MTVRPIDFDLLCACDADNHDVGVADLVLLLSCDEILAVMLWVTPDADKRIVIELVDVADKINDAVSAVLESVCTAERLGLDIDNDFCIVADTVPVFAPTDVDSVMDALGRS